MKENNNDLEKVYRKEIRQSIFGTIIFFLITLVFSSLYTKYDNVLFAIVGGLFGIGFMANIFELIENIKDLKAFHKKHKVK